MKRITSMCGSEFPASLASRLEAVQDDAEAQFEIGVAHAIEQCLALKNAGVPGMHFYVPNKSQACERILSQDSTSSRHCSPPDGDPHLRDVSRPSFERLRLGRQRLDERDQVGDLLRRHGLFRAPPASARRRSP